MDIAVAQWISVVSAGVMIVSVVGLARMLAAKANKIDVDKEFHEVSQKFDTLRSDNKTEADESMRRYRELLTAFEQVKDKIVVLDKNSLTKNDLMELKGDVKDLVRGVADAMKLIDGMPDRLVSLEATRNKQSEMR